METVQRDESKAKLEAEIRALKESNASLRSELCVEKAEVQKLCGDVVSKEQEVCALKVTLAAKEVQIDELKCQRDHALKEAEKYRRDYEICARERKALEERCNELERCNHHLDDQLRDQTKHYDERVHEVVTILSKPLSRK